MVGVLADPALYAFTGGEPPSEASLRRRYERQVVGRSPDGSQEWLNWIVRDADGVAVGYAQATVTEDGARGEVAWVIGTPWQSRGYAGEAAAAVVEWLTRRGVTGVTAHVHRDHAASRAVARRAGLTPTDDVHDGEQLWALGESHS